MTPDDTSETLKEAQIIQTLMHKTIPVIIGVQLQKEPISLVTAIKGEQDTSVTISRLLSWAKDQETVQDVQTSPTKNDWLISLGCTCLLDMPWDLAYNV